MRLVVVHYHLNRGGVTSVIDNHLRGLATCDARDQPEEVVILHGGRSGGWNVSLADEVPFSIHHAVIPELEYDAIRQGSAAGSTAHGIDRNESATNCTAMAGSEPSSLELAIRSVLKQFACQAKNTILHVHNHSLGKNADLPAAVIGLARQGWRILLQPHDFAEELRPANYRAMLQRSGTMTELQSQLYPQASHLHYGVLTNHDYQVLRTAGVAQERLHRLPNPIHTAQETHAARETSERELARTKLQRILGISPERPYVIYPVRGIRRKNVGELLLWASVLPHVTFAITLAPKNPVELKSFQEWQEFAEQLELSVRFDVGQSGDLSLSENYAAADAALTTSIAEGFGLIFLEANLAGCPLFGRDLPGVTRDFREAGIQFPGLTDSLMIPTTWIEPEQLIDKFAKLSNELIHSYGIEPKENEASESVAWLSNQLSTQPTIDFSRLDRKNQQQVIQRVATSDSAQSELHELNPVINELRRVVAGEDVDAWQRVIRSNQAAIESHYSHAVVGAHYQKICQTVLNCEADSVTTDQAIGESVLKQFVQPSKFYPLRLE